MTLWSAVSLTPLTTKKVDFIVKYLREYEAIYKKALTHVSGAQMKFFDEKTRGRKGSLQTISVGLGSGRFLILELDLDKNHQDP
jgi:hypothetical protein